MGVTLDRELRDKFRWGQITARVAVEQAGGFNLGEYAAECYNRLSKRVRVYAGLEG